MKQKIRDGQTLADVAVQEYGAWEAMMAIARENGMSITDVPRPGTELTMPDATWNRTMQNYCRDNEVSPATAHDQGNIRLRIFNEEFTEEFE